MLKCCRSYEKGVEWKKDQLFIDYSHSTDNRVVDDMTFHGMAWGRWQDGPQSEDRPKGEQRALVNYQWGEIDVKDGEGTEDEGEPVHE